MASNPYVAKVIYGENVLVDLTQDNVTADKVLSGAYFHDKSGARLQGTAGARFNGSTTEIPSSQGSFSGTTTTLV